MTPEPQPRAEGLATAVARVLRGTRPGETLSYGELARLAGHPGAARAVGRVLAASSGLPWWRVIHHNGELVRGHEERQARLLRAEGARAQTVAGRQGHGRDLGLEGDDGTDRG
ncbi:MAG: MGMT family protein [Candidatus Dormibacteria bacterium]